jgi:choline-phosphate cytidylyltransferase
MKGDGWHSAADNAADGHAQTAVRVYCDGVYDLFHYGHARQLEQAKHLFPRVHLTVGVCSDADVLCFKGPTVLTAQERCESVRHCRWVDEIVPDAPWVLTDDFLHRHCIDYVAHDAEPYAQGDDIDDVYAHVKRRGMFRATQRTPGISTSDLIGRILRDGDKFQQRNLHRGHLPASSPSP